jgi:hypothetical protein
MTSSRVRRSAGAPSPSTGVLQLDCYSVHHSAGVPLLRAYKAALVAASLIITTSQASGALLVSANPTQNVACSAGVCTASASHAVLNVADLANMLNVSNVILRSGSVALDIRVGQPFSWLSAYSLTLDAYRTIHVGRPLVDAGSAPLILMTNDGGSGGTLAFGGHGRISFAGASNSLTIDGSPYRLAHSIAELASNIAVHPAGFHALANDYDASADGSYARVPIPTAFKGTFEGLGNTIAHISIYDTADTNVGLFAAVLGPATLRNVRLRDVNYLIENTFNQVVGGLVGYNAGTVLQCSATGQLRSDFRVTAGGLVGVSYGKVQKSFADVFVSGAVSAEVGGLIGNAHGTVTDDYATGRVIAGDRADVGGLVGYFIGKTMVRTYATGQVSGGQSARVGGLVGANVDWASGGTIVNSYWDTTRSGTLFGAGSGDTSGITGTSTAGLQLGLPNGFDSEVWTENPNVNDGLPILLDNRR